jgi:Na+/H+-translocating membrane pyrophosphatase
MLVFLFGSFAIKAVGNSAQTIVEEVRRQCKADRELRWARPIRITARAWIS